MENEKDDMQEMSVVRWVRGIWLKMEVKGMEGKRQGDKISEMEMIDDGSRIKGRGDSRGMEKKDV